MCNPASFVVTRNSQVLCWQGGEESEVKMIDVPSAVKRAVYMQIALAVAIIAVALIGVAVVLWKLW